ncbi:putative ABC transporter permease [Feifania hominis]|uniref:ABC-transporter type IV n=1 Tax=Feifania hominis TaxID=2763660 RepID=A0A926DDK3_9FIRM|nr:putative ABC transporter permease [Feifania hominis]MBC8535887.1 hypothetical protein [Feifania hominis]
MKKQLVTKKESAGVFGLGAVVYSLMEIGWRGFTHWTMTLTGGLCTLLMYRFNVAFRKIKMWKKCLAGCAIVTSIEFTVGVLVNRLAHWHVWDYSRERGNLMGQVCVKYSFFWFLLAGPMVVITNILRKKVFHSRPRLKA